MLKITIVAAAVALLVVPSFAETIIDPVYTREVPPSAGPQAAKIQDLIDLDTRIANNTSLNSLPTDEETFPATPINFNVPFPSEPSIPYSDRLDPNMCAQQATLCDAPTSAPAQPQDLSAGNQKIDEIFDKTMAAGDQTPTPEQLEQLAQKLSARK